VAKRRRDPVQLRDDSEEADRAREKAFQAREKAFRDDLLTRYGKGQRFFRRLKFHGDLSGANLGGADLGTADLYRANLANAELSRINLAGAALTGCDLSRATLTRASLMGAALEGANLNGADLTGAILVDANLCNATLEGTMLSGATLQNVVLAGVDLRSVVGLEEIRHFGPSHIGERTLQLCRGRLPEAFLRGVGFSDWQIQMAKLYDSTLRSDQRSEILYEIHRLQEGAPIMFFSVFISYSSEDEAFCSKLHDDLQEWGVRCWFAPHDVRGGKKLHEQIERAIHLQDRLLLVLSDSSMASAWVKTEIANARAKERDQGRQVLFPIRLVPYEKVEKWKLFDADAGTDTAREIREYLIPDFSDWREPDKYKLAVQKLVRDLRAPDPARPSAGST
jgi:uncharacterized protein YjbI with pentapeptide repeats